MLGLRNPNNIAVACIYLLNDGSEVIFIVKATQQHIQRALPGFVFGEAFNGLEFYNYFFLYEVVLV